MPNGTSSSAEFFTLVDDPIIDDDREEVKFDSGSRHRLHLCGHLFHGYGDLLSRDAARFGDGGDESTTSDTVDASVLIEAADTVSVIVAGICSTSR